MTATNVPTFSEILGRTHISAFQNLRKASWETRAQARLAWDSEVSFFPALVPDTGQALVLYNIRVITAKGYRVANPGYNQTSSL